jgi:ferredoxin
MDCREVSANMKHYYLRNVVTLTLFPDKCTGCGMCESVCPHKVFTLQGRKIEITDKDACMECGACAQNCPTEALTVRSGVGCASGIIQGALSGTEPCCGPSDTGKKACC